MMRCISHHIWLHLYQYEHWFQQIEEEGEAEEDKEGVAIAKAHTHVDLPSAPPRRGIRSIYKEVERKQYYSSPNGAELTPLGKFTFLYYTATCRYMYLWSFPLFCLFSFFLVRVGAKLIVKRHQNPLL